MKISIVKIRPALPERLVRLEELAHNLWWCWHHEAIELFHRLDRDLWEAVEHNPVRLLGEIDQERLEEAAREEGFIAHMNSVLESFDQYINQPAEGREISAAKPTPFIAYFAAEFGLTESLSIYSGGLAVLAGDHLKAASDLGLPLAGVGLLYREGYFQQYLNETGWQLEKYVENDFHTMPLQLERDARGEPLKVELAYPEESVQAQVWRVQVGRVPLYLLDTDLEANRPEGRQITACLYGGDVEMRIRQEILLGIGGMRIFEVLRKPPTVCHMNEGHSAFLGLERIRLLMEEEGLSFYEAKEAVTAGMVFTTHTPVAAGIDIFPPDLVARYFAGYAGRLQQGELRVGDKIAVEVDVHIGKIEPQDVSVELFWGRVGADGEIHSGEPVAMQLKKPMGKGRYLFYTAVICPASGLYGYALRIHPRDEDGTPLWEPGLFFWA